VEAVCIRTSGSAEAIGTDEVGVLSSGTKADLLAVRGDVSNNIRALNDVLLVVQNGYDVDRSYIPPTA
jgi:imidazolonepropionase-like amidohydrolase